MYELVEFELHQRADAKLSISALLSYCGQYKAVRRVCDFRASLEVEVAAVTDISPHTWVHRSQEERKM